MDEVFARGVARAGSLNNSTNSIKTLALDSAQLLNSVFVHQFFTSLSGHRVMGMMDDAGFSIFQAIARSLGSRFLCSGQHSWGGGGNYHSRHQILSAAKYQGIGSALRTAMAQEEQGYFINETSLGIQAIRPGDNQINLTDGEDWAASLAEALTMISLEKWRPGKVGTFEHPAPVPVDGARRQLTSFVIEL